MKKKEKVSLHGMSVAELNGELIRLNERLRKITVAQQREHTRNVREAKALRNKRAVIKSILRLKELVHE